MAKGDKAADVVAIESKVIRDFLAARRVSTPLVGIQTSDAAATMDTIADAVVAEASAGGRTQPAILVWDCLEGIRAFPENEAGQTEVNQKGIVAAKTAHPAAALVAAKELAPNTVLFMVNLHRFVQEHPVMQGVWNLRDRFKLNKRTLVLLGPTLSLPAELENDVIVLDEPLPNAAELGTLVRQQYKNAGVAYPSAETIAAAVDAVGGLPAFTVEQITAMSMKKAGVDLGNLWDRKRLAIEQTDGLAVYRGGETFADIGGCENVKANLTQIVNGRLGINGVVFIDEIEKQFGGGGPGDSSGTTMDQMMQILTFMQDKKVRGLMFVGHPGTAKSAIAKAAATEAGKLTIALDLGGMKNKYVGASEERMRTALKVIDAVTQGRPLFIATCNSIASLPAELRRRFKRGTFFFDLPTADERAAIWTIYGKKFGLDVSDRPDDTDWTGAEIETCVEMAWDHQIGLREAAHQIIPIAQAMRPVVEGLRESANEKFLSASYQGKYRKGFVGTMPKAAKGGRAISV